jgi:hypothetical protein
MPPAASRNLIPPLAPSRTVDPEDRLAKKLREAQRLRDVAPGTSLEMGFGLMAFARELSEAAERARPR